MNCHPGTCNDEKNSDGRRLDGARIKWIINGEKNVDGKRSFDSKRNFDNKKNFGSKRSFYGGKRSFGIKRNFDGEKRSFDDEKNFYGDERSFYAEMREGAIDKKSSCDSGGGEVSSPRPRDGEVPQLTTSPQSTSPRIWEDLAPSCTVLVLRITHRKWNEYKQQPSMLPGSAVPGSCGPS